MTNEERIALIAACLRTMDGNCSYIALVQLDTEDYAELFWGGNVEACEYMAEKMHHEWSTQEGMFEADQEWIDDLNDDED